MAPDIFVRILGGLAEKSPHSLKWNSQLDDSIGNTSTTVSWRVWKTLPNNVFFWLSFHKPIFETEKPFENVCTTRGLCGAARRMQQVST